MLALSDADLIFYRYGRLIDDNRGSIGYYT